MGFKEFIKANNTNISNKEIVKETENISESNKFTVSLGGENYNFTLKDADEKGIKSFNIIKEGENVETLLRFKSKDLIVKEALKDLNNKKMFMSKDVFDRMQKQYEALPNYFFGRIHGSEFSDEFDMIKKFGKEDVEKLIKKLK